MLGFVKRRWLNWWLLLFTSLLFLLNSHTQLASPLFSHDFNAWLLPAIAPLRGLGMPYRDYWAIEPPTLLLMTTVWAAINQSLAWFHVLYLLLQTGVVWLYWRLLGRIFPKALSVTLYSVGLWLYFSPAVQSMFFPSEINGLFFSLLGLNVLLGQSKPNRQVLFASAYFGLAGQMKEVFAFTLLALLPLYFRSFRLGFRTVAKVILSTIGGLSTVFLVTIAYLAVTDSLAAYQEVLINKSVTFQITNFRFILGHTYHALQWPVDRWLQVDYSLLLIGVVTLVVALWSMIVNQQIKLDKDAENNSWLKLKLPPNLYSYATAIFFWIGSWLGYLLQNRYSDKYDIAIIFPLIIGLGIVAQIFSNSLKVIFKLPGNRFLLPLMILLLLAPNRSFLIAPIKLATEFRLNDYFHRWQSLENSDSLILYQKIADRTNRDECIQGVYGWSIANLYLYTHRKPCSRFFLPNIITADQIDEYRQELFENPPAAIYYSQAGADLDIQTFEDEVFPYQQVIRDCYQPDNEINNLNWSLNPLSCVYANAGY